MLSRVALLAMLLVASRVEAAETWTYASSEHFEVYTTAGAGTARGALTYFERIHAFFAAQLRLSPKQKVPTRLIIFSNDRQFAPYRPNEVAAAFYLSGADRDYIVMGRLDEESDDIVAHEYVHLVIQYSGAKLPVWLNEGLAEFFSTATPEGGKMNFGKVPRNQLLYLRSGVPLIDLPRLFAVGHNSPEYNTRSHAGVFYAESWALTHMLAMDARYRGKWNAFLATMQNGTPTAEALAQVYNKTAEVVRRDLVNYLQQEQYLYRQTDYKLPRDIKYETRAATGFEAQLVTANLLANSPESEVAARAAFAKLDQEQPNEVGLLESRGYFELHRGHLDAAVTCFARAFEQGSTNPKMMMDYARLDPSKAATLVARALTVAPENPDVRIEQGRLLMRQGKSAEAVRSFDGLTGLDRQQAFDAAQVLANAYMQLGRTSDAREAVKIVVAYAEEGAQAAFAARLARSIEDYAAQRDAFELRPRTFETIAADPGTDSPAEPSASGPSVPNVPTTQVKSVTVAGRIRNIVCENGETILEVQAPGRTIRLLIDSPKAITVLGQRGYQVDLKCGPQDVAITVGFEPGIDAKRGTVGYVRVLDYR